MDFRVKGAKIKVDCFKVMVSELKPLKMNENIDFELVLSKSCHTLVAI